MSWVIAGKPDGEIPIVRQEYEIRDSRKGTFSGRILSVRESFADVEVTGGTPRFRSVAYNASYDGVVSIRDTLVYLIEKEQNA